MAKKIKTSNIEKIVETESKNTSQNIYTIDTIRSPTLTEGLHLYLFIEIIIIVFRNCTFLEYMNIIYKIYYIV